MKQFIAQLILDYLRFFAKLQLKKNPQAKIVGITGSAGKTSAKQAVIAALGNNQNQLKLKFGHKANSESGIPLEILGLEVKDYSILDWSRLLILAPIQLLTNWEKFDYYIVEMGIDSPHEPKNMSYLLKIIQPQIGVFLNASAIHSQMFDELITETNPKKRQTQAIDLIAAEKGKLLTSLAKSGSAIFNADDQRVKNIAQTSPAKKISFGQAKNVQLRLTAWSISLAGSSFDFVFKKKTIKLKFPGLVLGQHYAPALSTAILVALEAGLSLEQIKANLEKHFQLAAGRSSLIAGTKGSYLLDSSYNGSGMIEMIQLAGQLEKIDQKVKRCIAILGDMRELGQEAAQQHQAVAKLAAKTFDLVYLVGPEMKEHALPILQQAAKNKKQRLQTVDIFIDSATAGRKLVTEIKKGDLVLLKGSQNTIFIEKATEILMAKPHQAKKLLCRQSDWWLKVKK